MGGIDKTAIEIGGVRIVDRVTAALATTCDRVLVVGRDSPGGPAAAVASVASDLSEVDVAVVVAGDLALVRPDHVEGLLSRMADHDAAAAVDTRGLPNPLVAVYRAAPLRQRLETISAGDRADRLLPLDTILVELDGDATFSVNTPEDLEEAERRLSR